MQASWNHFGNCSLGMGNATLRNPSRLSCDVDLTCWQLHNEYALCSEMFFFKSTNIQYKMSRAYKILQFLLFFYYSTFSGGSQWPNALFLWRRPSPSRLDSGNYMTQVSLTWCRNSFNQILWFIFSKFNFNILFHCSITFRWQVATIWHGFLLFAAETV